MKFLIRFSVCFLALFAIKFSAHAANPSYQAFIGTNGIIITSNPPQGRIIIDGSLLTNGISTVTFADLLWTNEPSGRIHPTQFTNRVELQRVLVIGTNYASFAGLVNSNDFLFAYRDITKGERWGPRFEIGVFSNSVASRIFSSLNHNSTALDIVTTDEGANSSSISMSATADNTGPSFTLTRTNGSLPFSVSGTNITLHNVQYTFPQAQGAAGTAITNDGSGKLGWGTVASVGGGGLTTNANQFLGVPLSIKDAALLTNAVNFGAGFLGTVTNVLTAPQFLGTNVVFDGSLSSWFQFNAATGPQTNYVFTNLAAGQTIIVKTFITNGTTVRLWGDVTEFPAAWYRGNNGTAKELSSNAPSVLVVSRDPLVPSTNVAVLTRDLEFRAGSNVTLTTNFPAGIFQASVADPLILTNIYVTNITVGTIIGTTGTNVFEFINLSAQAAKLPTTNYPGIDAGWQNWETVYAETNAEGSRANLNAIWQFMVPPDYTSNSMSVLLSYSLANTNGPNASNVVWGVSILTIRSGTTNNIHTNLFGFQALGTNDWAPKYDGTNITTNVLISLGTNAAIQSTDLAIMKIERLALTDTYGGAIALHGIQLQYTGTNSAGAIGTVTGMTNLFSATLSNSTIKPLVVGVGDAAGATNSTGEIRGLEAGANITITPNGSNYVIASTGGGGGGSTITTNANQFGASVELTLKDGAFLTNLNVETSLQVSNGHAYFAGPVTNLTQLNLPHLTALRSAVINAQGDVTNSSADSNWSIYSTNVWNDRQFGSDNLTNWSNIPTGAMANVVSTTFLTNWSNAISNYVTTATNSASVTNWITTRQPSSLNLSNLSGTGAITSLFSPTLSNTTIKPLVVGVGNAAGATNTTGHIRGLQAGGNVTLSMNGSNIVIAASVSGTGAETNANQFGPSVQLTIKDSPLWTNAINRGAGFLGAVTNNLIAPQFLGTNVVFDGSVSSWFQFNVATGPATNFVFTNIQAGQTIQVSTFVTNGSSVRLWANTSEIPASWFIGNNGGAFGINSNAPSVLYVSRNPLIPATNVMIWTRDLEAVAGSGVTFTTNFPAGTVVMSASGGGSASVFTNSDAEVRLAPSTGASNYVFRSDMTDLGNVTNHVFVITNSVPLSHTNIVFSYWNAGTNFMTIDGIGRVLLGAYQAVNDVWDFGAFRVTDRGEPSPVQIDIVHADSWPTFSNVTEWFAQGQNTSGIMSLNQNSVDQVSNQDWRFRVNTNWADSDFKYTADSVTRMRFSPGINDGDANPVYFIDTRSTITTAALFSWRNHGTNMMSISALGDLTLRRDLFASNMVTAGTLKLIGGTAGSSLIRTDSSTNLAAVTIGTGLSFDGTTLSANVLTGSASLDFPSTSLGAVADLRIAVTGAASGDVVSVGVPPGSITATLGSYSGFASNDSVFVRFTPVAATQNPDPGTFKVNVSKF